MLLTGLASRTQCWPPSVVSHSDEPKMKPCIGLANRIPHTALASPGKPNLASGACSPAQVAPRFSVRTRDVHGCTAQGAVPSTNPSSGETNVTERAAKWAGTGPIPRSSARAALAVPADPAPPAVPAELPESRAV